MVAAVKTTAEWCWSLIPNKSWTFQSHKSGETGAAFRSRQMCNEAEQKNKELQINALIYTLGKEAEHIHVFNALTFKEGDEKKYNVALNKFEEHFVRKWNIIQEWACFHQCVQKDGETVEAFIENLYELTKHCKFGLQRDQQIRDRIVIGILDKSLSQKLQMKSDLNLDTAIKMAHQTEHVKVQVAGQVDGKHLGEVNQKNQRLNANRRQGPTQRGNNFRQPGAPLLQPCSRCNRAHRPDETCPLTGAKCLKGKKK